MNIFYGIDKRGVFIIKEVHAPVELWVIKKLMFVFITNMCDFVAWWCCVSLKVHKISEQSSGETH